MCLPATNCRAGALGIVLIKYSENRIHFSICQLRWLCSAGITPNTLGEPIFCWVRRCHIYIALFLRLFFRNGSVVRVTWPQGFWSEWKYFRLRARLTFESKTCEMKLGVPSFFWLRDCNHADSNTQQMSALRELLMSEDRGDQFPKPSSKICASSYCVVSVRSSTSLW